MVCADCRELVDALIGRIRRVGPSCDAEFDQQLNRCPTCTGSNLRRWVARRCPKCQTTMVRGPEVWLCD